MWLRPHRPSPQSSSVRQSAGTHWAAVENTPAHTHAWPASQSASLAPGLRVGWVVAACGYICFFTGVPAVLLRWARPRAHAFYVRIAILVLLSASMVLPDVIYYVFAQPEFFSLAYSGRHLFNPLRTIADWRLVEMRGLYLMPTIIGAIGLLTYGRLMLMNRRTSRTAPIS